MLYTPLQSIEKGQPYNECLRLNAIIAYSGKADLLFFSVETRNIEKWIAEEK